MGVRKAANCKPLFIAGVAVCLLANPALLAFQESANKPAQGSSSSSGQKSHRHHTRVTEEEGPQPELARAEDLIQKRDYPQAKAVLQNLVASDPENYVAWFDLGFVENAMDKPQDAATSISC